MGRAPAADVVIGMPELPQRFVHVGEELVHLVDVGAGPSIVLETGAGGAAAAWLPVMRLMCEQARLVAVDRPGAGWSGTGDAVLPYDVAHRLHATLLAADVPPPYVLVGHSLGALHVRAFAAAYPTETAGLVLLDPTHEQMDEVLAGVSRATRVVGMAVAGFLDLLAALPVPGISRIAAPLLAPRALLNLITDDPVLRRRLARQASRRSALRASIRERRSVPDACAGMRAPAPDAEIPVLVLSAADPDAGGRLLAMRTGINRLHADLASQWRNGEHRVAPATTHLFPIQVPHAAADGIRAVLAQVERESHQPS
jgi:pimeloyl-ACP methyl ester carboxylesterase